MHYLTNPKQCPKQLRITEIICMVVCLMLAMLVSTVQAKDSGIENLRKTGKAFASVAKKVSPAVVFVQVEKTLDPIVDVVYYRL